MLKLRALCLAGTLLCFAGGTVAAEPNGAAPSSATAEEKSDIPKGVELALEALELSQGEGGFEIWRLKAEWADMEKYDGKIVVKKPRLTYFMQPDRTELVVTSDAADVDQKNNMLRFTGNVVVTRQDQALQGPLLVYNGTAKTMTLPDGANLSGTNFTAVAESWVWRLNDHILAATGGVDVNFLSSASLSDSAVPVENGAQPPAADRR